MLNRRLVFEIALIIFGGLCTTGLALYNVMKNKDQEKELKIKQKSLTDAQHQITEKQDKIIALQSKYSIELQDKTDKIIKLQDELNEKSNLLSDLQKENLNTITGGNSFCEMILLGFNENSAKVMVFNHGKYPLYDLTVRIVDLDILDNIPTNNINFQTINTAQVSISVGNLAVGSSSIVNDLNFKMLNSEKKFNVFFSARNGFFTQQLIYRFKNEKYLLATRITETHSGKALYSKIDEGFLNPQEQEPIWK